MTIQEELLAATNLKPKVGEDAKKFTLRVASHVHGKFSDEKWQALSEEAQAWVNDNITANEKGTVLQLLTLPEVEAATANVEGGDAKPAPEKVARERKTKSSEALTNGDGEAKKSSRGRKSTISKDTKVHILATENPHREGTKLHDYFSKYKEGMSIKELEEAGVPYINVKYLQSLGHIQLG